MPNRLDELSEIFRPDLLHVSHRTNHIRICFVQFLDSQSWIFASKVHWHFTEVWLFFLHLAIFQGTHPCCFQLSSRLDVLSYWRHLYCTLWLSWKHFKSFTFTWTRVTLWRHLNWKWFLTVRILWGHCWDNPITAQYHSCVPVITWWPVY